MHRKKVLQRQLGFDPDEINYAKEEKGLNKRALARKAGVTERALYYWLRGEWKASPESILKIRKAIDKTPSIKTYQKPHLTKEGKEKAIRYYDQKFLGIYYTGKTGNIRVSPCR